MGIHLKLDGNAVPPKINVPHPVSDIAKGRKNNIANSIEVRFVNIKTYYVTAQFTEPEIKNNLNVVDIR